MLTATNTPNCRNLLLAAAACFAIPPMVFADEPAPRRNQARYEVKFLEDMIDHHMMAVMTATLCEERAIHPELQDLCEAIVATQAAEIEAMQGWLEDWYGIVYEPEMTRRMEREVEFLAMLSGEEFEIAFMEMMIDHHEGAIKEGTKCAEKAFHEALVELCENIVVTQAAEIEQMETWLCDWYDICD